MTLCWLVLIQLERERERCDFMNTLPGFSRQACELIVCWVVLTLFWLVFTEKPVRLMVY